MKIGIDAKWFFDGPPSNRIVIRNLLEELLAQNKEDFSYIFLKKSDKTTPFPYLYKNVKVINDGSISEWIYNAKIVVHSGCTGGLEASVRGRPTISYLPFKSVHGHPLCDKFSIKTKNLKQCLNAIKKVTKNKTKTRIKKPDLNSFKLELITYFQINLVIKL